MSNIPVLWDFLKVVQRLIGTTRSGVFEAFLFMGIGMVFAYQPIYIKMKKAIVANIAIPQRRILDISSFIITFLIFFFIVQV